MAQNTWTLGNDVLPNGNVLIAFQAPMNKVVEYDADGNVVWSVDRRDEPDGGGPLAQRQHAHRQPAVAEQDR